MPVYQDLKAGREPGIHILMEHGGRERICRWGKRSWSRWDLPMWRLGHIHKPGSDSGKRAVYPGRWSLWTKMIRVPGGWLWEAPGEIVRRGRLCSDKNWLCPGGETFLSSSGDCCTFCD